MRVACVLVDHFLFRVQAMRDPFLKNRRVILFKKAAFKRVVVDVSPSIGEVTEGMPVQEAQGKCMDAGLVEADMSWCGQVFNRIVLRLANLSPVVEATRLGCAYVDLDGLERSYGNEARLMDRLLSCVPKHLEPRVGVSQGKFPAYLAAMTAMPGGAHTPSGNIAEFMVPFSVDVLPVPSKTRAYLHSFGLHTLGHLASMPLGPIQAQFGPMGARMWHIARGLDDAPLLSRHSEEQISDEIMFEVPAVNLRPLLVAVEVLLGRLFSRPEMAGRFARALYLEGCVLNGPNWQRRFVFKAPIGNKAKVLSAIKASLIDLTLPGPLEDISLTLKTMTGEVGNQESLFQDVRQSDRLREVVAQLKVSQRQNPIYQIREVEPWSRLPERRQALVPFEP